MDRAAADGSGLRGHNAQVFHAAGNSLNNEVRMRSRGHAPQGPLVELLLGADAWLNHTLVPSSGLVFGQA